MPSHPAQHPQRPALQRMTRPGDRHQRREVLETGSKSRRRPIPACEKRQTSSGVNSDTVITSALSLASPTNDDASARLCGGSTRALGRRHSGRHQPDAQIVPGRLDRERRRHHQHGDNHQEFSAGQHRQNQTRQRHKRGIRGSDSDDQGEDVREGRTRSTRLTTANTRAAIPAPSGAHGVCGTTEGKSSLRACN